MNDESIIARSIKRIIDRVIIWSTPDSGFQEETREATERDLISILEHQESDGYKMAKALDNLGWDPDSELVEILERLINYRDEEFTKAQEEWVVANNIKLEIPLGTKVKYKALNSTKNNWYTVVMLDYKTARYGVSYPLVTKSRYKLVNSENIDLWREEDIVESTK